STRAPVPAAPEKCSLWLCRGRMFVSVERAVGCGKQFLEGGPVARVACDADADGKRRRNAVIAQAARNSLRNMQRRVAAGFGQHENKFVAAVAGCHINLPAIQT